MSARRRRSGGMIGSRSKSMEKEFIKKAKYLAKNPEVLVPRCEGKCFMCPFTSIHQQLLKVAKYADDEEKLVSLSKRGNGIARAYAGTLLIGVRKKISYTAQLKTPVGIISYVQWGKTTKEKTIGVQYYDDPELRLLSVNDIAKSKGIYIFSDEKGMICTGKKMNPPDEFLDFLAQERGVNLTRRKFGYGCPHSTEKAFTGISVKWHTPDIEFRICKSCIQSKDMNTLHHITGKIAGKKINKDFSVEVIKKLECKTKDCTPCEVSDWDGYEDYMNAAIKDAELVARYEKNHFYKELEENGAYVIGEECYGTDFRAFVKALEPAQNEKKAIVAFLKRADHSVILDRPSVSKVLMMGWPKYAKPMLMAINHDKELVSQVIKMKFKYPQEAIAQLLILQKEKEKLSSYPKIARTTKPISLLDRAARLYKVGEIESIGPLIESTSHEDNPRLMAIKMAIYTAIGKAESHYWKYPTNESELGRFLGELVLRLFNATEDEYIDAMQAVIDSAALNDVVKEEDA